MADMSFDTKIDTSRAEALYLDIASQFLRVVLWNFVWRNTCE